MEKLYWGLTEEEITDFFLCNKYRYEDHLYEYKCSNPHIEGRNTTYCNKCNDCIELNRIELEMNSDYYKYLDIVKKNKSDWKGIDIYQINDYFPELRTKRI